MKLVRGNREHGNSENSFRTIRRATSEDFDHLPMQGQSDFVVCGNKQVCKLQFLESFQIHCSAVITRSLITRKPL